MGSECRFTDGGTVSQSLKKQKYDLTGHIQTLKRCTLSVKYLIIIARMYPFVTMSVGKYPQYHRDTVDPQAAGGYSVSWCLDHQV